MPSVSSIEQAPSALAAAHAEGRRIRIGVDLTTDGLTRVLEHDPGDLTCTVESGVRLSELREVLAAAGQRLSLDPPGDPTVGALLARNVSGPLRHRFGAPRDLVLGVTLVLGDGTVANAGGKVVKNVAGYDLARLVCGSEGRLAFIARASFRLHPLPKAARTLVGRDLRRRTRRRRAPPLAAPAERARRPPSRPRRRALRGLRARRRGPGRPLRTRSSAERRRTRRSGTSRGRGRRRRRRCVRFAPGELASTLAGLDEAVVRPAAGVAYSATSVAASDATAAWQPLVDRIAAELDPRGVLAA